MPTRIPDVLRRISIGTIEIRNRKFHSVDDSSDRINELAESFLAFAENRYAESDEVRLH